MTMSRTRLVPALLGIGTLSLVGCELSQSASRSSAQSRPSTKAAPARVTSPAAAQSSRARAESGSAPGQPSSPAEPKGADGGRPVNLIGLEEQQLRALLGPPAAEEDRPPGKIWRYRKGGCTLNFSLYPDVQ